MCNFYFHFIRDKDRKEIFQGDSKAVQVKTADEKRDDFPLKTFKML